MGLLRMELHAEDTIPTDCSDQFTVMIRGSNHNTVRGTSIAERMDEVVAAFAGHFDVGSTPVEEHPIPPHMRHLPRPRPPGARDPFKPSREQTEPWCGSLRARLTEQLHPKADAENMFLGLSGLDERPSPTGRVKSIHPGIPRPNAREHHKVSSLDAGWGSRQTNLKPQAATHIGHRRRVPKAKVGDSSDDRRRDQKLLGGRKRRTFRHRSPTLTSDALSRPDSLL